MAFTRQHYIKIADIIFSAKKIANKTKSLDFITKELIAMFKRDNPLFDESKFVERVLSNPRKPAAKKREVKSHYDLAHERHAKTKLPVFIVTTKNARKNLGVFDVLHSAKLFATEYANKFKKPVEIHQHYGFN